MNALLVVVAAMNLSGAPASCFTQCDTMQAACSSSCKQMPTNNPHATEFCNKNCSTITNACKGSCRDKGRIDEDYMRKHIPIPKVPPGGGGGADDDDH